MGVKRRGHPGGNPAWCVGEVGLCWWPPLPLPVGASLSSVGVRHVVPSGSADWLAAGNGLVARPRCLLRPSRRIWRRTCCFIPRRPLTRWPCRAHPCVLRCLACFAEPLFLLAPPPPPPIFSPPRYVPQSHNSHCTPSTKGRRLRSTGPCLVRRARPCSTASPRSSRSSTLLPL